MKKKIIQINSFKKSISKLIANKKLLAADFEDFKKNLIVNPDLGEPIAATGGVRKTRLKSASKGKRGGFRVCYFDDTINEQLFLLLIYPKNVQEDLSPDERKALKKLTCQLRMEIKDGKIF